MSLLLVTITSCNKAGSSEDPSIQNSLKALTGTMYYQWADEGVFALIPRDLHKNIFLPDDIHRNAWHISRNGKLLLQCMDSPDQDYDAYLFTIKNTIDKSLVSQFKYYPTNGSTQTAIGHLSFDGSKIAVDPTFDDGIVVLDQQGHELQHLEFINGEKISGEPIWMPDNTLLFAHKNLLRKKAVKPLAFSRGI